MSPSLLHIRARLRPAMNLTTSGRRSTVAFDCTGCRFAECSLHSATKSLRSDVYHLPIARVGKSLLKSRFDFCFKANSVYPAILKANIVKNKFSLGNYNEKINFETFQLRHGIVNVTAYLFEKTLYISDCNDFSIVKRKAFKNLNYLIIDCLRIEKNFAHFNLDNCLYIHKKLNPKKTYLTNLSYNLDYNYLKKNLPKNILPAYDGLKINL